MTYDDKQEAQERAAILSESELREIVRDAVSETLKALGLDTAKPREMQKDFIHLRNWREANETIRKYGLITIVTACITGFGAAVWVGIKHFISSP